MGRILPCAGMGTLKQNDGFFLVNTQKKKRLNFELLKQQARDDDQLQDPTIQSTISLDTLYFLYI